MQAFIEDTTDSEAKKFIKQIVKGLYEDGTLAIGCVNYLMRYR